MNKFFRILLLVFLGLAVSIELYYSVLRLIRFGPALNSLDWVVLTINACTIILAFGSFLFHLRRLKPNAGEGGIEQVDTLLDDHLTRDETLRNIPTILRVSNILFGFWALLLCLVLLATIDSPNSATGTKVFVAAQVFGLGYSFVYIIIGSLVHFVRHGK